MKQVPGVLALRLGTRKYSRCNKLTQLTSMSNIIQKVKVYNSIHISPKTQEEYFKFYASEG